MHWVNGFSIASLEFLCTSLLLFGECGENDRRTWNPSFLEIHVLLGEHLDIAKEKNVMLNVNDIKLDAKVMLNYVV